jgi:hypothetical protein
LRNSLSFSTSNKWRDFFAEKNTGRTHSHSAFRQTSNEAVSYALRDDLKFFLTGARRRKRRKAAKKKSKKISSALRDRISFS